MILFIFAEGCGSVSNYVEWAVAPHFNQLFSMSTNCALFVYLYRGVMATAQNRTFITFIYCLFVFYLICLMSTLTVQSEVNVTEKMNDVYKVFVYGTLKRGEPNHHWFSNVPGGKSRFLYQARTTEKYPLIIATDYNIPFLLYAPGLYFFYYFVSGNLTFIKLCFCQITSS